MGADNQNGNLRWHLPLGVRPPPPPPLMTQISRHFFTPLFSFAIESYIYETDFTLGLIKISLLSPLMIGSKLSFSGCCNRRLPYDSHVQFIVTLTNTYIPNIKLKLMCKARFGSQGVILDGFLNNLFSSKYLNGTRDPPPHPTPLNGKIHL